MEENFSIFESSISTLLNIAPCDINLLRGYIFTKIRNQNQKYKTKKIQMVPISLNRENIS